MRGTTTLVLMLAASIVIGALGLVGNAVLRLAEPNALWLLVVPWGIVSSWLAWWYWRGIVMQRLGTPQALARMATGTSTRLRVARMLLTAAAALFFVFGAARPQWGEQPLEVTRAGIDVVFAVDLSRSMLATDLAPSRLEAVRAELDRLMRRLDGDRVGLVVFAADAVRQSPLTSDYGAIRHYLRRAHPDHFSRQGTAIGRAIGEAQRLLIGEEGSSFARASTQVIVVVSDGEDTISDPLAAAAAANEAGIRVFTVGMGTVEGARIPLRNPDGTLRGYLRDRAGNEVVTRLVEDQLEAVADSGGGDYRRYSSEGSIATWLETSIAAFDREALSSALRVQYADRFLWFVVPGLLLLLLASSLPEAPRRRGAATAVALVLLTGSVAGCDLDLQRADPRVEAAMASWQNQEAEQARALLESVGESARALPSFSYNEALVFEALSDLEGAQRRYLTALGLESSWARARALYGLGNTLMAREQLVEAIARYQRALALDPDLEDARRNLQIALLRLYPACAALDDEDEPNDAAANARDLPHAVYQGTFVPPNAPAALEGQTDAPSWVVCGGNDDLHALPLMGGSIVTARVALTRLRDDTGGPPLPDQIAPQAVRIALRAYDGTTTLAVDQGLVDEAGNAVTEVSATSIQRAVVRYEVDALQPPDAMGFLLVQADPGLEYRYTVEVEVEPPCYALEDAYESNDLASTATPTQENYAPRQARLCYGNADWYRLDLPAGNDAFVDVTALVRDDQTPGQLVVDWFVDDVATPVSSRTLDTALPETTFRVTPTDADRVLYWRVTSPTVDDEGQYTLTLFRYPPCPDGNDRFEPNDAANARRTIGDAENPLPLRHLRICEGDNDWFEVTLPSPPASDDDAGDTEASKEPRPFSILVRTEDPNIDIRAAAWDAANGELLLVTEPLSVATEIVEAPDPPPATPDGFDSTTPLSGSAGATLLAPTVTAVVVQVAGQPGFYDLELPDTEQQQQQQQEQQQQEESGEGGEDAQDDAPANQDPQGDEESEADPNQDDSQEPSQDEEQARPPEEPASEEEQAAAEAAEERARLLELLDSLEKDDLNLQMRQALDNLPAVEVEQPW